MSGGGGLRKIASCSPGIYTRWRWFYSLHSLRSMENPPGGMGESKVPPAGALETPLGGISEPKGSENSAEMEELGRFAVDEYNKKANAALEFVRVADVREQVVQGMMYYLTVEALDEEDEKGFYQAKVWVKPWMNFKKLEDFQQLLLNS